ncbi:MAG TPA: O-antigen ligase family protein [Bacillota bacterium]|nr:O-antigen ligase family protein [Bacillota bacterium]
MKESLIFGMILKVYDRLVFYYENSMFFIVMQRLGHGFGKLASSSSILSFFDMEWNIADAWKQSLVFRILTSPLRWFGYASQRFSEGVNAAIEGSRVLKAVRVFLENLLDMSTRVYGLLFTTFSAAQGLLDFASGSIIELALFLGGAALILINRPVKALAEGSIITGVIYGFFNASHGAFYDRRTENAVLNKSFEITAIVTGIALGAIWHFLQPVTFVLAVGGIAALVLVLWRYEIGVFAVAGFIPLAPTMALLGLILLTAVSFFIRLFRDKSMKLRSTILDYFVVLFGIVLLYSFITSYTPGSSMLALLIHIAFIVFYFILVNTIKTRQQLYVLAALLVLSTTVTALYGLYQLKTVGATSEAWVDTTLFEDIKARVGSTFENPNVLGEYLVLIIPVAIAMLWGQKNWISKLIILGLSAIMLGCLVYTYSRGAYVGLMLAFALFAVLRDRRFIILGVIGLLMLPFMLPASVINRFASIGNLNDTSSFYRISVWLGSLRLAQDYWLSGIGLGLEPFNLVYPKYSLNAAYALHSHNIYIQLMIETGIAGLLMFFAIIAVYYKTMLAGFYKTRDRFTSTFMIAIASGMAGYLAQGMVENIWYNNRVLLTFWVMLAFGMIAKALITEDKEVSGI